MLLTLGDHWSRRLPGTCKEASRSAHDKQIGELPLEPRTVPVTVSASMRQSRDLVNRKGASKLLHERAGTIARLRIRMSIKFNAVFMRLELGEIDARSVL